MSVRHSAATATNSPTQQQQKQQQQQHAANNNKLCISTTALSVATLISDRSISRHSGGSVDRQHPAGPNIEPARCADGSIKHTAYSGQGIETLC